MLSEVERKFLEKLGGQGGQALLKSDPPHKQVRDLEKRGYVRVSEGLCVGRPTGELVVSLTEAGVACLPARPPPAPPLTTCTLCAEETVDRLADGAPPGQVFTCAYCQEAREVGELRRFMEAMREDAPLTFEAVGAEAVGAVEQYPALFKHALAMEKRARELQGGVEKPPTMRPRAELEAEVNRLRAIADNPETPQGATEARAAAHALLWAMGGQHPSAASRWLRERQQ